MSNDVCIIGAGIVGLAAALELQERGMSVVIVDRAEPGMQTSFGNAGVLAVSTVMNVNNPNLFRALPAILTARTPYVRYGLRYALTRAQWLGQFLNFARTRYLSRTAAVLRELQCLSIAKHRHYIKAAGAGDIFRESGWLKVFRSGTAPRSASLECQLLDELGVAYEWLSASQLKELEPALEAQYSAGLLLSETCSVTDPLALVQAYLALFRQRGGLLKCFDVTRLEVSAAGNWISKDSGAAALEAKHLVIACGPWSADLCGRLGYAIPMAWERGYHANLESPPTPLNRPVFDVERGFVMAPQGATTRISSGVEFAHRDAEPDYTQINLAVADARKVARFGSTVDAEPWLGSRPTLPDGLPMVGKAPRHARLWLDFGHQHMGMSTSAASAVILADALTGTATATVDAEAVSPDRFRI